jgi:hypothetical protein
MISTWNPGAQCTGQLRPASSVAWVASSGRVVLAETTKYGAPGRHQRGAARGALPHSKSCDGTPYRLGPSLDRVLAGLKTGA